MRMLLSDGGSVNRDQAVEFHPLSPFRSHGTQGRSRNLIGHVQRFLLVNDFAPLADMIVAYLASVQEKGHTLKRVA